MAKETSGWHFSDKTLLDGQPLRVGHEYTLAEGKEIRLCTTGYHSSKLMLDALVYAGGTILSRTQSRGKIIREDDKFVAERRLHLWSLDVSNVLRDFARRCALDVVHLWNPPEVVLSYLRTGDHELAAAAWEAAWAARAAWAAAGEAAAAGRAAQPAWAAAKVRQNRRLTAMVMTAKRIQK